MIKISKLGQILVMIILVTTLIPALSAGTVVEAKAFSATLTPTAGLVQYQHRGDTKWITVREATLVNQDDLIRTGNDGLATLSIVTGIKVDLSNSTQVELNKLVLCDDNGSLQYTIFLLGGEVNVTADQKLKTNDHVQLEVPTAGITIDGVGFYALLTPQLNTTVLGLKGKTTVTLDNKKALSLNPNDLLRLDLKLPTPAPTAFTADFLNSNVTAVLVSGKAADVNQQAAIKLFLKESLTSRYNLTSEAFLRDLVGLPALKTDTLTADQETAALQETLKAIDAFDITKLNLKDILNKFFATLKTYQTGLTKGGLAPLTCGGGTAAAGETAVNCATDLVDVNATCGNGLVEADGKNLRGESVANCPADSMPLSTLARTGLTLIDDSTNALAVCGASTSGGGGGSVIVPQASGLGSPQ